MSAAGVSSIAVAVVRWQGRVLIGRRPSSVPLAGYWEFPGGKIRSGEQPQAAARRECREETGLDVQIGDLLCDVEYEYGHGRLRLHFFAAQPTSGNREPTRRFRWVEISQLPQYEFPPANQAVIQQLIEGAESSGDC
jgi:8-oxo-dGTP diphosphatase